MEFAAPAETKYSTGVFYTMFVFSAKGMTFEYLLSVGPKTVLKMIAEPFFCRAFFFSALQAKQQGSTMETKLLTVSSAIAGIDC